tara:strand:+ start:2625 stop:3557 length:933 start_codon:yes stop_codon:yes gene_type:complete
MIQASAPSNIALIKYMGKTSHDKNLPSNSSLSITTEHLRTTVSMQKCDGNDKWTPMQDQELLLSEKGQKRYLDFLAFLKDQFAIEDALHLQSGNNFPADAGLASSASSFAALTLAAYEYAKTIHPDLSFSQEELANLSRRGSGSSCRSLFGPACLWSQDSIREYKKIPETLHFCVLVEKQKKKVSSSEAHKRISTSLLNEERAQRAEKRLVDLDKAFDQGAWKTAYEICWQEFWDMHVLFETSQPPFSFMQADSLRVLRFLQKSWEEEKRGPLVTMDAGPNVHVFYLREDQDLFEKHKTMLKENFPIISQ